MKTAIVFFYSIILFFQEAFCYKISRCAHCLALESCERPVRAPSLLPSSPLGCVARGHLVVRGGVCFFRVLAVGCLCRCKDGGAQCETLLTACSYSRGHWNRQIQAGSSTGPEARRGSDQRGLYAGDRTRGETIRNISLLWLFY